MTPGYVHASKRGAQAIAQLEASLREKNRLLVKTDQARAKVQGELDLAQERIKALAKANGTLAEEVKALTAQVKELEAQHKELVEANSQLLSLNQDAAAKLQEAEEAPAPVEPARDENALLIDALETDNARLRSEKSQLAEDIQALRIENATLDDRLTRTQRAAKAYREANGQLGSQVEGLVEAVAGAVIPGQVLAVHEGQVVIHRRELDLPSLAQTLRQAAEAVTAHALTEELA